MYSSFHLRHVYRLLLIQCTAQRLMQACWNVKISDRNVTTTVTMSLYCVVCYVWQQYILIYIHPKSIVISLYFHLTLQLHSLFPLPSQYFPPFCIQQPLVETHICCPPPYLYHKYDSFNYVYGNNRCSFQKSNEPHKLTAQAKWPVLNDKSARVCAYVVITVLKSNLDVDCTAQTTTFSLYDAP